MRKLTLEGVRDTGRGFELRFSADGESLACDFSDAPAAAAMVLAEQLGAQLAKHGAMIDVQALDITVSPPAHLLEHPRLAVLPRGFPPMSLRLSWDQLRALSLAATAALAGTGAAGRRPQ